MLGESGECPAARACLAGGAAHQVQLFWSLSAGSVVVIHKFATLSADDGLVRAVDAGEVASSKVAQ